MQPPAPQSWQQRPLALLAAVLLGCGPIYGYAIYSGFTAPPELSFDLWTGVLNLLVILVTGGGLVLACLYFVNGETPAALQLARGTLPVDLWQGLLLTGKILFVLIALGIISLYAADPELPAANREIATSLASDPWLLAFWLGPVVWLQAALFEELMRTFMLSRLWRIWPRPWGKELSLLGSALLFGAAHAYQGVWGIIGTSLIGLMLGAHYLRHGRVLPLIIAHGIYDTLALIILVTSVRSGLI